MLNKPTAPYLGAAYYPEDWPLAQIDEDIALMKQAGMNVMRLAEFAWSRMEPTEGVYDFEWLHLAVNKLREAGIASILCTPTCTPPAWLTQKYPEVLVTLQNGQRLIHGARRHCCPNSPVYREHCKRITAKMVEEFSGDAAVIGWQIDNELFPPRGKSGGVPNFGCHCPVCRSKFIEYLQTRYGTIEGLNAAWGTDLWSQTYTDWSQIPIVLTDFWHHPSLVTAWHDFMSDSYVDFTNDQAVILRETGVPVGTDMMPTLGLDYHDIHKELDLVQFNHYNTMENLWQVGLWMNFCRPLKALPFWNTETSTCWNGAGTANGYREPGFCRVNSWMPFILGGEANLYWLWRAHWSGQELMHGSVVSSQGRPLHIIGEVQEVSQGLEKASVFLNGTTVKTEVALHFSGKAARFYEGQTVVNNFKYIPDVAERVYKPLFEQGIAPDVIDPAADLSPYKVVFSPFLASLEYGELDKRVMEWVEAGGVWVVGPMTDIRNADAAKYKHSPYGHLEDWADVYVDYQLPGDPRQFLADWPGGIKAEGGVWYDGMTVKGDTASLAVYAEGPLKGLCALAEKRVGKGRILLMGTMPAPEAFAQIIRYVCDAASVSRVEAQPGLMCVRREGAAGRGLAIAELYNRPSSFSIETPMRDLLTNEVFPAGLVPVVPYGVRVLVEQ